MIEKDALNKTGQQSDLEIMNGEEEVVQRYKKTTKLVVGTLDKGLGPVEFGEETA